MNKKFLVTVLLSIFSIFLLSGCAKVVSTENSTVQVKVIDEHYSSAHTTMIFNGKQQYQYIIQQYIKSPLSMMVTNIQLTIKIRTKNTPIRLENIQVEY